MTGCLVRTPDGHFALMGAQAEPMARNTPTGTSGAGAARRTEPAGSGPTHPAPGSIVWRLSGAAVDLDKHVGHRLQVTGKTASETPDPTRAPKLDHGDDLDTGRGDTRRHEGTGARSPIDQVDREQLFVRRAERTAVRNFGCSFHAKYPRRARQPSIFPVSAGKSLGTSFVEGGSARAIMAEQNVARRLDAHRQNQRPGSRSHRPATSCRRGCASSCSCPRSWKTALLAAIDAVFTRHERLWQESKHEAIQALSAGFADKMARVQDRAVREGRHRQQHLALLRGAGRRPHRQVAPRSEDEADELRPLHRAARVVPRARAARPLVRGRPRRHHRVQVVQRRARPRGRRSDHRARGARCCASRCGPTTCSRRSALGADAPRRICTRGSAATSSAS